MNKPYAIVIPVGCHPIGLYYCSGETLTNDFGPWVPHVVWTGNRLNRTKFANRSDAEAVLAQILKLKTRRSKKARVVRLRKE